MNRQVRILRCATDGGTSIGLPWASLSLQRPFAIAVRWAIAVGLTRGNFGPAPKSKSVEPQKRPRKKLKLYFLLGLSHRTCKDLYSASNVRCHHRRMYMYFGPRNWNPVDVKPQTPSQKLFHNQNQHHFRSMSVCRTETESGFRC